MICVCLGVDLVELVSVCVDVLVIDWLFECGLKLDELVFIILCCMLSYCC